MTGASADVNDIDGGRLSKHEFVSIHGAHEAIDGFRYGFREVVSV